MGPNSLTSLAKSSSSSRVQGPLIRESGLFLSPVLFPRVIFPLLLVLVDAVLMDDDDDDDDDDDGLFNTRMILSLWFHVAN